ncbi:hypothetical protein V6N11_059311 [Hibiscus sabdariffa]|uniref:Uncharacterized protein n=1 Tax=Hibiscus sabdariffa TaxID=183260 RepID=A0ABR2U6T8_9ROSI
MDLFFLQLQHLVFFPQQLLDLLLLDPQPSKHLAFLASLSRKIACLLCFGLTVATFLFLGEVRVQEFSLEGTSVSMGEGTGGVGESFCAFL